MKEEKYSNFSEGFFKGMIIAYAGIGYGLFSLYKFGQGDKKHLKIFTGIAVGLYGAKYIHKGGFRKKVVNEKKT